MSLPRLPLVCLALLLSGCITVPSPYAQELKPAAARYHAIKPGATRSDVEARFGKPNALEADGACVWETRFDDLNYAKLTAWFDPLGNVAKVEVTQARGVRSIGYQASATSTRVK